MICGASAARESSVASAGACYVTPYGWKPVRLYARLEARVFRPALTVMNPLPIAPSGPLNDALHHRIQGFSLAAGFAPARCLSQIEPF